MEKYEIKTSAFEGRLSLQPEFYCPIHGTVTETLTIWIETKNITKYCLRCYNDFLRNNIPVLEENITNKPVPPPPGKLGC